MTRHSRDSLSRLQYSHASPDNRIKKTPMLDTSGDGDMIKLQREFSCCDNLQDQLFDSMNSARELEFIPKAQWTPYKYIIPTNPLEKLAVALNVTSSGNFTTFMQGTKLWRIRKKKSCHVPRAKAE